MTALENLYGRIDQMDLKQPFVWRLRISAAEFAALEKAVEKEETTALQKIVYLAEWYKRCYEGNESKPKALELSEAEIAGLWAETGLDGAQYAFRYEKKDGIAWTYSTYVLGGLAVRFESGKKDRKFFRQLCRLYYGEELSLAEIADQEGRSVAFRQSVARHQSLYFFILEILNDSFATDDALTNDLIELVKSANDEVLRDKFILEWMIRHQPNSAFMRRSLRLNLKPEEVGGKLQTYVRYERILAWGVVNPERVHGLSFAVSFEDAQGRVLSKADFDHPVLTCVNAGQVAEGRGAFVVASESAKVEYRRVPSAVFSKVRLWVRADDAEPREVPLKDGQVQSWQQYWCEDDWRGIWSTRKNDHKPTAVLLSRDYNLVPESELVQRLPFKDYLGIFGGHFGFCVVQDSVTVRNALGVELATVYNRAGENKVIVRLYEKTICYEPNGLVKYSVLDEDGDEESGGSLPIIFRKDDVLIRHWDPASAAGERKTEDNVPDKVEFKNGANYCEWTDGCSPSAGFVVLRVTCRGHEFAQQKMFYYPGLFEDGNDPQPIVRDFKANEIRCRTEAGTDIKMVHVSIPDPPKYIERTQEVILSGKGGLARVKVYTPTDLKEVMLDEDVEMRLADGERFFLPYLLKNRIFIRDFGEHGFRYYACAGLGSLYRTEFIGDQNDAHLIYWNEGKKVAATELDEQAPDWIDVGFGVSAVESENEHGIEFWKWVYSEEGDPVFWEHRDLLPAHSVAFQNLAANDAALRIVYPKYPSSSTNRLALFKRPKLASPYHCYCVATKFHQYFFIFEPLRRLLQDRRGEIATSILEPLLQERGGKLKAADYRNLMRLAEEGRFDWFDLGTNLAELVADEEDETI